MMGRKKVRELEDALSRRVSEIEILAKRVETLQKQVDEYKAKEGVLASTLLEAQAAAKRILNEANEKADATVKDADEKKQAAFALVQSAEEEAAKKAAGIIEAAQAEAKRRMEQAEASAAEYKQNLKMLNLRLTTSAIAAKAQAEKFAAIIEELHIREDDDADMVREIDGLSEALATESEVELPEEYASPAELIHSLYAIQKRSIPHFVEDVETLVAEGAQSSIQGDALAKKQEDAKREGENMQEEADAKDETSDKVWTVEEIVETSAGAQWQKKEPDVDQELDAIVSDILREEKRH